METVYTDQTWRAKDEPQGQSGAWLPKRVTFREPSPRTGIFNTLPHVMLLSTCTTALSLSWASRGGAVSLSLHPILPTA